MHQLTPFCCVLSIFRKPLTTQGILSGRKRLLCDRLRGLLPTACPKQGDGILRLQAAAGSRSPVATVRLNQAYKPNRTPV